MSEISIEVSGRVAVITINRPERRNAIDLATAEAIAAALDQVDERDDVVAAILSGAGRTFCAGMDLKALSTSGQRPITASRGMFGIVERPPSKPIVAAVEGAALGGGFEVALACDLIVAAQDARFGLPEVKRGLVPAAGGMIRLPRRIPSAVALELLLTGEPIAATRAYDLGLINRVCAPGRARETALELATTIGENAPLAVRTVKQVAERTAGASIADAFEAQQAAVSLVRESVDAQEGTQAFVEKRPPVWSGR